MDQVLIYLLTHLSFLYKVSGFKIVDSLHSDQFGGNGLIILQKGQLAFQIINDRGQLFLDMRNITLCKPKEWYSSDLIWQFITGEIYDDSVLDEDVYPKFFEDKLDEIVECLTGSNAKNNFDKLKKMKTERAKRLFG